jgi:hypothetical protein
MPIDPSTQDGAFGPEATAAMGEAFDAACNELCAVGQLQMVRKFLAQQIIAAARKGELDPVHLRSASASSGVRKANSLRLFRIPLGTLATLRMHSSPATDTYPTNH